MTVRNEDKKPFRDLTPEERREIVEALISGDLEQNLGDGWKEARMIHALYAYRTRPRQLAIPWDVIKPEYKWAAMDNDGMVVLHRTMPKRVFIGFVSDGECTVDMLNINTAGIDWRESLTERPEGV